VCMTLLVNDAGNTRVLSVNTGLQGDWTASTYRRRWLRRPHPQLNAVHFVCCSQRNGCDVATGVRKLRDEGSWPINKMLISYLNLFAGVCTLLPLALQASTSCTPRNPLNAVTQRAADGRALCATSAPTETVAAEAKIYCVAACMRSSSCAAGVNYRSQSQLCEMYSDQPTSYQVQPNCDYLKVPVMTVVSAKVGGGYVVHFNICGSVCVRPSVCRTSKNVVDEFR